jgi:hypothetical protein
MKKKKESANPSDGVRTRKRNLNEQDNLKKGKNNMSHLTKLTCCLDHKMRITWLKGNQRK